MRLLITGVAGYLGSTLAGEALGRGWDVIGLDDLTHGATGLLPHLGHGGFEFHQHDIRRPMSSHIGAVDGVVHLAGLIGPMCEYAPDEARAINLDAALAMADWAAGRSAPMAFASSCGNYGFHEGVADETAPLVPTDVYSSTKIECEQRLSASEGVCVLRMATLAGLSPRPRFDTLLNQWVWESMDDGTLECVNPAVRRPFVHVRDGARAVVAVLEGWSALLGDCYNVVGFNATKGEVARAIADVTGCRVREVEGEGEPRDNAVSGARLAAETGFQPSRTMSDCIHEVHVGLLLGATTVRPEHFNQWVGG